MTTVPRRPVLRYHGGKWKLAPWIVAQMPPHRIYVEPFGGAASVLMRKPRVSREIYNDMDDEIVGVFRVLQDPAKADRLRRRCFLTPFARAEFKRTYSPPLDEIEAAAFFIARSFFGFGSATSTRMSVTGFRASSKRDRRASSSPALDWAAWPAEIPHFVDRLRGVVIENRPAVDVIRMHDSPDTLHYVDPPYVQSTRSSLRHKNGNRGHYYRHDMTDAQHRELAQALLEVKGMVLLSGYPCDLYDDLFHRWTTNEVHHRADGARARIEKVWMNEACALAQRQGRLIA